MTLTCPECQARVVAARQRDTLTRRLLRAIERGDQVATILLNQRYRRA